MARLDWLPFFQPETAEEAFRVEEEQEHARQWLEMVGLPAFQRHLDHIEREVMKPITPGAHADMIVAAVRGNTFKEIREEIRKVTEQARSLLSTEGRSDV
jgi:hypothetical protein